MHEPFKSLGEHEATLHLHPEVRGKLKVKVVAEKTAEAPADAE
jgi:ribosomal protein L9